MIDLPTLRQLSRTVLLSLLALPPAATLAATDTPAAPTIPPQITIVRESGKEAGVAQMIVKSKAHKITANAVQAWPVLEGQAALILVVEQKRHSPKKYVLRYYDLDSGRRRILGTVPFKTGNVLESETKDAEWPSPSPAKTLPPTNPSSL